MKTTPLHSLYKDYPGAKLIDFGGWELPVNFEAGIIAEHHCVRQNAGLFDVSHMGEIEITGESAEALVDMLVTNNVKTMNTHQCIYTPMCYPDGGTVDDLLVYKYSSTHYLLVVNASNIEKDYRWICDNNTTGAKVVDLSDQTAQIAFQGPKAQELLQPLIDIDLTSVKFFYFNPEAHIGGRKVLISRTGYTGEDGFEIYTDSENARAVWSAIYEAGKDQGVLPCGLGCRDTLRFEAKLPLYGHELGRDISPLEGGIRFFVKTDKEDFIGKDSLVKQIEEGIPRILLGCKMEERGVPREGHEVFFQDKKIGFVTSGTKSPTVNEFLALILVERGTCKRGDEIEIRIGSKKKRAVIVKTPFYKNT